MSQNTGFNPCLPCHHFNNSPWIIHGAPAQRLHMICFGGVTQSHRAQPVLCNSPGAAHQEHHPHHPQKARRLHRLRRSAALQSSPESVIKAPKKGLGPDSLVQEKKQNYWALKKTILRFHHQNLCLFSFQSFMVYPKAPRCDSQVRTARLPRMVWNWL